MNHLVLSVLPTSSLNLKGTDDVNSFKRPKIQLNPSLPGTKPTFSFKNTFFLEKVDFFGHFMFSLFTRSCTFRLLHFHSFGPHSNILKAEKSYALEKPRGTGCSLSLAFLFFQGKKNKWLNNRMTNRSVQTQAGIHNGAYCRFMCTLGACSHFSENVLSAWKYNHTWWMCCFFTRFEKLLMEAGMGIADVFPG